MNNEDPILLEIRHYNDLDKVWWSVDIIKTLELEQRVETRTINALPLQHKVCMSLRDLVDLLISSNPKSDQLIHKYPFCICKNMGPRVHKQLCRRLYYIDFGSAFNELWNERIQPYKEELIEII